MSGRRSRSKGQFGEREFFDVCNDIAKDVEFKFRRKDGKVFFRHPLPRHGAGQADNSDPLGVLPVSIEVKFVEKPQFTSWLNKLLDREQTSRHDHQTPVLAWRKRHQPWTCFVVMDSVEWAAYLKWKLEQSNGNRNGN